MGKLKNEYKSFLDDIEKNIKNKEDLEYIKNRLSDFLDVVLEQIDHLADYKEEEISKLEETQKILNDKVEKMQQVIDNIEKDIYSEEGFDFEIICPYCNNEFVIDLDEERTEVTCPECENIIELDWTGDIDGEETQMGGCSGNCHKCGDCQNDDEDEEDDM